MAIQTAGLSVDALYRACYSNPIGATEEELRGAGWRDKGLFLKQVNELMGQGLLKLIPIGPEGSRQYRYQAVEVNHAKKVHGLDDEHMLVLQKIEDTKGSGAWSKTLQGNTRLSAPIIKRITEELLKRKLIKEVKSAQFRNRKVFMKIDVDPLDKVSGGRWYHNGEWDAELVKWITDLCRRRMCTGSGETVYLRDIHEYIMRHPGPRRQPPTIDHVEDVMRSLELDEEICSVVDSEGERMYSERRRGASGEAFDVFTNRLPLNKRKRAEDDAPAGLQVPCISCRIREQCRVGGLVCPEKCEYLAAWLGTPEGQDDW
jgi:hypothetical protein